MYVGTQKNIFFGLICKPKGTLVIYSAAFGANTAPKILTSFSMWELENYPEKLGA